jgi:hypothetical protein
LINWYAKTVHMLLPGQGRPLDRTADGAAVPVGKCCGKVPARSSLQGLRVTLQALLTPAMTDELISRNIAELIKLPTTRRRRTKAKAWESDDARRFLESPGSRKIRSTPLTF